MLACKRAVQTGSPCMHIALSIQTVGTAISDSHRAEVSGPMDKTEAAVLPHTRSAFLAQGQGQDEEQTRGSSQVTAGTARSAVSYGSLCFRLLEQVDGKPVDEEPLQPGKRSACGIAPSAITQRPSRYAPSAPAAMARVRAIAVSAHRTRLVFSPHELAALKCIALMHQASEAAAVLGRGSATS